MIKSLKELESDCNSHQKLYELYKELIQQVPSPELPRPRNPFYFERLLESTDLLPDAYFIALHNENYVGMNVLNKRAAQDYLFNELTGVKQGYRKMGIASALKLRGIAYAKVHGYSTIKTSNNSLNDPILKLNASLGFIREAAFITFEKVFQ
jgi:mycothiol synthase